MRERRPGWGDSNRYDWDRRQVERFGEYQSKLERFIDPNEDVSLKEMVESERYPIRRVDIDRLIAIADATSDDKESKGSVKVLDLGGGKGLLAKLLADALGERGMVIDVDIDQEELQKAKKFYHDTPNLHFVASDSEKEAGDIFNTNFNLVIASWQHPPEMKGPNYSETVRKLKPAFVVNVGEIGQEVTGTFDPAGEYKKIGEWYGPLCGEISDGEWMHSAWNEDEQTQKDGSNLFEIYARKDISDPVARLKEIKSSGTEYSWEHELRDSDLFPDEPRDINFDINIWKQG
jgi:SAM-dependent methyltransferase